MSTKLLGFIQMSYDSSNMLETLTSSLENISFQLAKLLGFFDHSYIQFQAYFRPS
jgi:hypothetical protein